MAHPSTLDLDRYSSMSQTRRSATHTKTRSLARDQARTGDVVCDFCAGSRERAVKSCLVCQASFCEDHVQTHYEYPALMKHKLVKATGQMREKLCAQHDKLLEAYCRSDDTSVCVLCMMDEHKHHDTKQLGNTLHKSQQRIDGRVKKWQDLQQAVESLKHSAQTALDENERIFTELLRAVERKFIEVREMIQSHEKTTSWQALSGPSGYEDLNNVSVVPNYSFEGTKRAIAALKLEVEEASKVETSKISVAVKEVHITKHVDTKTERAEDTVVRPSEPRREPQAQPRSRQDFMKYAFQLTLDSNTVHPNLHLSEGNKTATMVQDPKKYSSHADRFDQWQQLLHKIQTNFTEPLYPAFSVMEVEVVEVEVELASRPKRTHSGGGGAGGGRYPVTRRGGGAWWRPLPR
ncbi:hypothetical protein CRUP_029487 [Coryphaenoides rupestris]|nr:hypothetical protein CRUP_029487 [Coryphaenoides rupestris]